MVRNLGVQFNDEEFSLLVKRAKRKTLLKTILISAGTSWVIQWLIRRKLLLEQKDRKGGNDVEI